MARAWMGLHAPVHGTSIAPHRAVAAVVHPPGGQSILVSSLYLKDSVGLDAENVGILTEVFRVALLAGHPVLIGGDWNLAPARLHASGLLEKLHLCTVPAASSDHEVTCTVGGRRLDFYLVSESIRWAMTRSTTEVRNMLFAASSA